MDISEIEDLEATALATETQPHRLSAEMRPPNTISARRQKKILDYLRDRGPRTVAQLSDETQCSYHTARISVNALHLKGMIAIDRVEKKARYYKVVINLNEAHTIPNVTSIATKQTILTQDLLSYIDLGREEELSIVTIRTVRKYIHYLADLFYLGDLASHDIDVEKNLATLRMEMQQDMLRLHSNLELWKQVLSNPFWWDTETLKEITNDPRYNHDLVMSTHEKKKETEE